MVGTSAKSFQVKPVSRLLRLLRLLPHYPKYLPRIFTQFSSSSSVFLFMKYECGGHFNQIMPGKTCGKGTRLSRLLRTLPKYPLFLPRNFTQCSFKSSVITCYSSHFIHGSSQFFKCVCHVNQIKPGQT